MLMTIKCPIVIALENDSMELINWFSLNLMKAKPDKFQAIAIGKKTKSQNLSFNLSGNKIVCEDNVKLLGVTIDSDLNFDNHISEMCKKTSRQLNILKRIGKYMNRLGRLTSYYSFILSNFNYCPVIWHYCSEKNQLKWKKSKNVHYGLFMKTMILLMKIYFKIPNHHH